MNISTALWLLRLGSIAMLIDFFLWTAHVMLYVPYWFGRWLVYIPLWITTLSATYQWLNVFLLVDAICFTLLFVVIWTTLIMNRQDGAKIAVMKALQWASAVMIFLSIFVITMDPTEVNLPITTFQIKSGIAMFYTNAVNFFCAGLLFAMTTTYVSLRRVGHF